MTRVLIYYLVFGVFLPNLLFAKEVEYSGETLNINDTLASDSIVKSGRLYVVEGTLISGNWEEVISAEIVVIAKTDRKPAAPKVSSAQESKIVKTKESKRVVTTPRLRDDEAKPVISKDPSNSSKFLGNLSFQKSATTPTSKNYQSSILIEDIKSFFPHYFYRRDLNDNHSKATPNYLLLFDFQIRPPPFI